MSLPAPLTAAPPFAPGHGSCRAIFLDRDGVLNRNVFYADTRSYESPRTPDALALVPGAGPALRALRSGGYRLILVSNQPNAAKGKCSRETLDAIHARLLSLLQDEAVSLDEVCYCYHHPDYTGPCVCRKPSPHFLLEAARKHTLDLRSSWMIGDRDTDLACGKAAGVRTVWINTGEEPAQGSAGEKDAADLTAGSVVEAVTQLLAWQES